MYEVSITYSKDDTCITRKEVKYVIQKSSLLSLYLFLYNRTCRGYHLDKMFSSSLREIRSDFEDSSGLSILYWRCACKYMHWIKSRGPLSLFCATVLINTVNLAWCPLFSSFRNGRIKHKTCVNLRLAQRSCNLVMRCNYQKTETFR